MNNIIVPPIKSQGIKTKLVPWINDIIKRSPVKTGYTWIEPFFGTGVVGFNSNTYIHIISDTNPHIINFYKNIQSGKITGKTMRTYLEYEGKQLETSEDNGYAHYRKIRDRFNTDFDSYDFIFLSRAGFNGMMRFNGKGKWNVPFCKKPMRFAPAYVTKICNQVDKVTDIIKKGIWEFNTCNFIDTIKNAKKGDLIYCDPPYYGRSVDYYNGWSMDDELSLLNALSETDAYFILSTWHHNEFRQNAMMTEKYWGKFNMETSEHYYHNGGKLENRHSMTEALVFNFDLI